MMIDRLANAVLCTISKPRRECHACGACEGGIQVHQGMIPEALQSAAWKGFDLSTLTLLPAQAASDARSMSQIDREKNQARFVMLQKFVVFVAPDEAFVTSDVRATVER